MGEIRMVDLVLDRLQGHAVPAVYRDRVEALVLNLHQLQNDCGIDDPDIIPEFLTLSDSDDDNDFRPALLQADYDEVPVAPEQFIFDERYFGRAIGDTLYDAWKPHLLYIMEPDNEVQEVVFTGSIGMGKTHVSTALIGWQIYRMLCLKDPHRYYGKGPLNPFYYGLYNVHKYKGQEQYEKLETAISLSPWFQERLIVNKQKKWGLEFPKSIKVVPGSNELAALGENLISVHISEVNFMRQKGTARDLSQAWRLYSNCKIRMRSRFQQYGIVPGLLILDSSRSSQTSFLEKHLAEYRDDPTVYVVEGAQWDFLPPTKYSGRKFRVAVGTASYGSRILAEGEEVPADVRVVEVPVENRPEFELSVDEALRDVAGVATMASHLFFQRPEALVAAKDARIQHPFSQVEIELSTLDDRTLVSYLVRDRVFTIREGKYAAKHRPGVPRFAHIDLSRTGDCSAIAIGHIDGMQSVDVKAQDFRSIIVSPVIRMDLMLRIRPPQFGEIDYSKIRMLILALREGGMPIVRVTADGWQCVAAGTRVPTQRGILPVEQVVTGDVVQSRVGPRSVTKTWAFGRCPVIRITTTEGRVLEGTSRHRIEATGNEPRDKAAELHAWKWVRLDELKIGDTLRSQASDLIDPPYVELPEISPESLGRGCRGRLGILSNWTPPTRLTEPLAEFLGLLWGDGHVTKDGIHLHMHKDETGAYVDSCQRLFGVELPVSGASSKKGRRINVSGRFLVRWLGRLGLLKWQHDDLRIPELIWRSPRSVQAAFLRGLFTADGDVRKSDGRVSLTTAYERLARDVVTMLLTQFGIRGRITPYMKWLNEKLFTGNAISITGERSLFLDKIGFVGPKREALARFEDVRGYAVNSKVHKIEMGFADVYDLEVEEDHAYVADGFVSHNSTDCLQILAKAGFDTEVYSTWKTDEAYKLLASAVTEGRFKCYDYPPFFEEAPMLQYLTALKKIDHLPSLSKDVADAVAGVVGQLMLHWNIAPEDMKAGEIPRTQVHGDKLAQLEGTAVAGLLRDYRE